MEIKANCLEHTEIVVIQLVQNCLELTEIQQARNHHAVNMALAVNPAQEAMEIREVQDHQ